MKTTNKLCAMLARLNKLKTNLPALWLLTLGLADSGFAQESKSLAERQKGFLSWKFRMFIHFNVATFNERNGAWGCAANDHHWKSPNTVVHMLVEAVSKGGNFLLNVGPTAEGVIPQESVIALKQVGAWLLVNGETIYGAGPCDLRGPEMNNAEAENSKPARSDNRQFDWLATSRPASAEAGQTAKIYLHLFKWSGGRFEANGLTHQVARAYLLGDVKRKPIEFSQKDGTFSVRLLETAPASIDTVICLDNSTK